MGRDPTVPCAQLHKNPTAARIRAQRCICMPRTKACALASSSIYKPSRLQLLRVQLEIKISGQHTTWSRWCHTLPPYQHTYTHNGIVCVCAGLRMKPHTKQRRSLSARTAEGDAIFFFLISDGHADVTGWVITVHMHNYFRRRLTAWKDTDVKKDGAGAREPGCVWQAEREKKGKPNAEPLMRETRR